jgi:adenine C2-methylase RlmN of 23S rRNA A2503 and tRNA A37
MLFVFSLVYRFSMGNADTIVSRILYNGMGEPSTNYPNVLHKFHLLS